MMPFDPSQFFTSGYGVGSRMAEADQAQQAAQLKMEYGPEMAATQMELERQKLELTKLEQDKAKLANMVTQANFDQKTKARAAVEEVTKNPEFKTLSLSEQLSRQAAALQSAGEYEAAKNIYSSMAAADLKEAQAEAKKQQIQKEQLGNVAAGLAGLKDPNQIKAAIASMPPAAKQVIQQSIPNFFQQADPNVQKAQLDALILNASGRTNELHFATQQRIAEIRAQYMANLETQKEQFKLGLKMQGYDNEADMKAHRLWERDSRAIDEKYKTLLPKALQDQEEAAAMLRDYNDSWSLSKLKPWGEPKEAADYKKASQKVLDYQRQIVLERIKAAERLPDTDQSKRLVQSQVEAAKMLGMDKDGNILEKDPTDKLKPADSSRSSSGLIGATKVDPSTFTGENKAAYDWAKANSSDPRAKEILKKLRVE